MYAYVYVRALVHGKRCNLQYEVIVNCSIAKLTAQQTSVQCTEHKHLHTQHIYSLIYTHTRAQKRKTNVSDWRAFV